MEGGNVTPIDLEAGLDIKSSDMLVPFVRPTFQHNWQRYQGHCLPNSLRYEQNGWAAGWNVYNFEYNTPGVNVDTGLVARLSSIDKGDTFRLGIYSEEDDTIELVGKYVIPKSEIKSISRGSASLNGNVLTGIVNGKNFSATWSENLEKFILSDISAFEARTTKQSINTWSVEIIDKSTFEQIANTIWHPLELTCDAFTAPVMYDSFVNGVHNWGNYEFDGSRISVPYGSYVTNFTVNGNTLTFSYTATLSDILQIHFDFNEYYKQFNELELTTQSGTDKTIYTDATLKHDFNKWEGHINRDYLPADTVGDSKGVLLNLKIPVWLSAVFKPDLSATKPIQWPNNINTITWKDEKDAEYTNTFGNVLVKVPSDDCTFIAKSVFENVVNGSTVDSQGNPVSNPTETHVRNEEGKWLAIGLPGYRFNAISCSGTIKKSPTKWNPYPAELNDSVWLGELRRFKNFREGNFELMRAFLGKNFYDAGQFKSPSVDISELLELTDFDSYITTEPNLYKVPFMHKKGKDAYFGLSKSEVDESCLKDIANNTSAVAAMLNKYWTIAKTGGDIRFDYFEDEFSVNASGGIQGCTMVTDPAKSGYFDHIGYKMSPIPTMIAANPSKSTFTDNKEHSITSYGEVTENARSVLQYYDAINVQTESLYDSDGYYVGNKVLDFNSNPYMSRCPDGTYADDQYDYSENNINVKQLYWPFKYMPMYDIYDEDVFFMNVSYYIKNDTGTIGAIWVWPFDNHPLAKYINKLIRIDIPVQTQPLTYKSRVVAVFDFRKLILGEWDPTILPQNSIFKNTSDDTARSTNVDRTRAIDKYPVLYDFDYAKYTQTDEKKVEFNDIWNDWYHDVPNPLDLVPVIDTTYDNFDSVEPIVSETPLEIEYTRPGIVLGVKQDGSNKHAVALSVLDSFMPIERAGGEGHIFHNHVDAADDYDLKLYPSYCRINAKYGHSTHQVYRQKVNPSNGSTTYEWVKETSYETTNFYLPVLIGSRGTTTSAHITAVKQCETYEDTAKEFESNYCTVSQDTVAGISMIATPKQGTMCWFKDFGLTYKVDSRFKGYKNAAGEIRSTPWTYPSQTPESARVNERVYEDRVKVVYEGWEQAPGNQGKRHTVQLQNGFEKITRDFTKVFEQDEEDSNNNSIVIALPVWGHILTQVNYLEKTHKLDLMTNPKRAFTFVHAPDSRIDTKDKKHLWLDRSPSTAIPLACDWFILKLSTIMPGEQNDEGYINLKLNSNNNAKLYYAKKHMDKEGNEITAKYYYPPICGMGGNMSQAGSNALMPRLRWTPSILKVPKGMSFSYKKQYNDVRHIFYDRINAILSDSATVREYTIKDVDDNDMVQLSTYIKDTGSEIVVDFNTFSAEATINAGSFSIAFADVSFDRSTGEGDTLDVELTVACNFNNVTGRFARAEDAYDNDRLVKYADGKFIVSTDKGTQYVYDNNAQKILNIVAAPTITREVDSNGKALADRISFENYDSMHADCIMSNISSTGIATISYNNKTYNIDINNLLKQVSYAKVLSTDIRKPQNNVDIGKIVFNDKATHEYQLVKQAWDSTVKVENFWWIDSTHIMELTNYSIVVKSKTSFIDDWAGDKFTELYTIPRSKILIASEKYYTVTNTYNMYKGGLFITMSAISTDTIECKIYNPLDEFKLIDSIKLMVMRHEIGTVLNATTKQDSKTALLNTYSNITADQILTQAEWSNTYTNDRLFIGCHLSNNFDQWTAIFTVGNDNINVVTCIQGYGYVSLHGDLTGGMIPKNYFNEARGFNNVVHPLSDLLDKDLNIDDIDNEFIIKDGNESLINKIDDIVVGTAERQWYIRKELKDIVSHLRYMGNDSFIVECLPITNNYDAVYKSPSFYVNALGDLMIQAHSFKSLFDFPGNLGSVWTVICGLCSWPMIYMFAPRFVNFVYLQQTFGQYAYVHYNSSESNERQEFKDLSANNGMPNSSPEKANASVLSDEYTFGKEIFRQTCKIEHDLDSFAMVLFGIFAPALQHIDKNLIINGELNQSAVSDIGKKYSQSALENLSGLVSKAIMTEGSSIGLSSNVIGIKSLDMFYSTSDKQHIYAGPGFVEHQFVADCVAQSVTDVSVEGKALQLAFIIKMLTVFQGILSYKLQDIIADGISAAADKTKELMICANNVGAPVAAALEVTAYAMRQANEAKKIAYDCIEKFLDVLCQRNVSCEVDNMVTRFSTTTEAKHKYGEKNETFMWPCWGIEQRLEYTDESVEAVIKKSTWECSLAINKRFVDASSARLTRRHIHGLWANDHIPHSSMRANNNQNLSQDIDFYQAACRGIHTARNLPSDMSCIQGVSHFMPEQAFKNENIGMSEPVFPPSMFQDYIIDKIWDLSQCCTYGKQQWVAVKDTKVINCPASNMYVNDIFCGVAAPYTAIEVKRGLSKKYMRPFAITPNVLAFNCTGHNCILDNKLYHAFDGISYRLVEWTGTPGLNKQLQTFLYGFQVNDRFKRSNKFPANELLGNFSSEPTQAINTIDKFWTKTTVSAKEKGMEAGTVGEDKDLVRWAIPVFTEPVTTLPAAVKTLTAMPLAVVDGITGLVTDLANNQIAYKAPLSVDFTIGKNVYRQTEEYICSVVTQNGVDVTQDLVPSLGLRFIGSTPTEAFFYSEATRCYYSFTGTSLVKMDMMERFRDVQRGYWDFVNQEVIMPCLMTFKRLNAEVEDKDTETDNIIVPVMSRSQVSGELPPPLTTIFNDRSWYKAVSLPSGFAYQGPNRVIINRQVFVEYMLDSLKSNLGKWQKMPREKYSTKRVYPDTYKDIMTDVKGVKGWTYNPFLLVTSALGQSENVDCMFEWVITFCWPIEMDLIYGPDNYACVNIMAETMTPGGKLACRPTHVFLKKELFTRTGNYGYYSFRFQSKNGAGNRERLHIWSDQYIAISSIDCDCKVVSSRRNEQLVQQLDVQKLKEL